MQTFVTALLFLVSFAGTKFLGLDRTVQAFKGISHWVPSLGRRPDIVDIRARIAKGYAFLPLQIECLDQALVAWFLLNRHRYPAALKIGVSLAPLHSHAWVDAAGEVFGDVPRLADYHIVAEYSAWTKGN